jgi:hypothetical protein
MATLYSPKITNNGLITYIDFSNPKSSPQTGSSQVTVRNLVSASFLDWTTYGTGSNGTGSLLTANSLLTDGFVGRIYSQGAGNGTATFATAWSPNGFSGSTELTVELVFSSTDGNGNLFSRPWNGNGEYNYRATQTSLVIGVFSQSAFYGNSLSYANICDGTTQHMVWWMGSTQYGVYRNGQVYVAPTNHNVSGGGGGTPASGSLGFGTQIGSLYPYGQNWAGNTNYSTAGTYYLCRIYNRVLTPDEVTQNFNATRGRFGL